MNDSVTKCKFDNLYGCRESLVDGIKRATDVMMAGKMAVVCGYGDVGKGSAQSLRGLGATVLVTEIDPICALQAAMEGYRGDARWKMPLPTADIFVTATGNSDVITASTCAMKDQAIVCNIGHFDNEIEVDALEAVHLGQHQAPGGHVIFPDGNASSCWRRAAGEPGLRARAIPSFVMSNSFTNQVLAQIELCTKGNQYDKEVYVLPKHLDEEVARLHLEKIGAKLTELTTEQADYIGVPVEGPLQARALSVLSFANSVTSIALWSTKESLGNRSLNSRRLGHCCFWP